MRGPLFPTYSPVTHREVDWPARERKTKVDEKRNEQKDMESGPTRRQFLRQALWATVAFSGAGSLLAACAPEPEVETAASPAPTYLLPDADGSWTPQADHAGVLPSDEGSVRIDGVGTLTFPADQVESVRPDIFQPSHFSLFDVLVYLAQQGEIRMDYHFDEEMDTHVIDRLDGRGDWWYQARYSAGWYEPNVHRMDMYPYKNSAQVYLFVEDEQRLAGVYRSFREEVSRLAANGSQVIIPRLTIAGPRDEWTFEDVVATPHGIRSDVLQPDVVTALDALISLGEEGKLSNLRLTWYETIARADPVDTYFVERINDAWAVGGCGFVYETGPLAFAGFRGTHIHIPSDVRVVVSPEYARWFWICLGGM
jgi:hypothetical protein